MSTLGVSGEERSWQEACSDDSRDFTTVCLTNYTLKFAYAVTMLCGGLHVGLNGNSEEFGDDTL